MTLTVDVVLGMVGDEWHGPTAPGPGWVNVGKGPRGGLRWKQTGAAQAPQPQAPQALPANDIVQKSLAHLMRYVGAETTGVPQDNLYAKAKYDSGGKLTVPEFQKSLQEMQAKGELYVQGQFVKPGRAPQAAPPKAAPPAAQLPKELPVLLKPATSAVHDPKAQRAAKAASEPPGKRGGPGSALRGVLRDVYDYGKRFKDNEDGLVPLPSMYAWAKRAVPNLTPEEFKAEMKSAYEGQGPEGRMKLFILNEVHTAQDPSQVAIWDEEGEKLLYYAYWYDPQPPAKMSVELDRHSELFLRALAETGDAALSLEAADEAIRMEDIALAVDEWQSYRGDRGGQGWRNIRTGEILYQQAKPGTSSHIIRRPQKPGVPVAPPVTPPVAPQKSAHPWEGLDPQQQRAALEKLNGALMDFTGGPDPLKVHTGPPPGLDMKAFAADLGAFLQARHAGSVGVPMDQAYQALSQKCRLGKHDFVRAVTALYDAGNVAMTSPASLDHITDPQLVGTQGSRFVYYVRLRQAGMSLSLELFDKKAQAVLDKAMEASKRLSAEARRDLEKALAFEDAARVARAVLDWVERWRSPLASLLSYTQISSFLAGMGEVMRSVPGILQAPGDGPLPPSLPPEEAARIVERLRGMTPEERERAVSKESVEHQVFLRSAMREPPPSFAPPKIPSDDPGRVHLVTIDEAVKELSSKRLLTKEEYARLDAASQQKAFTVAGVESRMTLEKVRDALAENVREGADLETFREKVLADVDEGTFLSEGHMETVFRTSVQQAFSDGQVRVWNHPVIKSGFPFVTWHSVRDDRRRPEHGAMEHNGLDGTAVYLATDPTIRAWWPPCDFNCRCGVTFISVDEAAHKGVKLAKEWLSAGAEPPPVYVPYIPPPNPDFKREAPLLSLQLSALPLDFAHVRVERKRRPNARFNIRFNVNPGEWQPHRSVAGHPAWKNIRTGEIRYQPNRPGRPPQTARPVQPAQKTSATVTPPTAAPAAPAAPPTAPRPGPAAGPSLPFRPPGAADQTSLPFRQAGPPAGGLPAAGSGAPPPNKPAQTPPATQPRTATPQPQKAGTTAKELRGVLKGAIDKSGHLKDEEKQALSRAVERVTSRMPATAATRARQHTNSVEFHSSIDSISGSRAKSSTKAAQAFKEGYRVAGYYQKSNRKLALDGTAQMQEYHEQFGQLAEANIHGVYAHEISHAIDGPDHELSFDEGWRNAFEDEIMPKETADAWGNKADFPLSEYATTMTYEGFAEFGRLVYGTDHNLQEIEQAFPKASAFWKSKGIWPSS